MILRRDVLAGGAVALAGRVGHAQPAENTPVRMVVPYSAGGVTDLAARLLANEMSLASRAPVLVENRPGGGGNIGVETVVRAPSDGHTLLMAGWGNVVLNPHLYRDLKFNPVTDLVPVALTWTSDHLVVVNPKTVAASSLAELVALGRASARPLTMGSAGNGSGSHIVGELFQSVAQVRFTHVPYKGTGQAMNDLLGGHIDLMFDSVPSASPNVAPGKLRALAITGERRDPAMPAVPTFGESGYARASATGWGGIFAPVRTDTATVRRLAEAVRTATGTQAVHDRLQQLGAASVYRPPQDFREFIRTEYERWGETIRKTGITL